QIEPVGTGRRVTIELTRAPEGVHETSLGTPPRLMIDLDGARPPDAKAVQTFALSDDALSQVRIGSHAGQLRAVLDFSREPGPHTIRAEGTTVVVERGGAAANREAGPSAAAPEAPAAATPKEAAPKAAAPTAGARKAAAPAAEGTWLAVKDVRVETAGAGRRLTVELTR